jgi:hypothetical protein
MMIQIPQNLQPENFLIEPIANLETNKIKVMKPKLPINNYTIKEILNLFCIEYKTIFNRDFRFTDESKNLLYTILYYFFWDAHFFKSPNSFKPDGTNPSFEKGLLIMGNTGTGKTSILLALENVFNNHLLFDSKTHFRSISAHQVVNEFEKLKNPEEREDFFIKHQRGFRFYDDVKSENDASNYGKENLFKKILYQRNEKRLKTIITCNYNPSFADNFEKGLDEFGIRYDGRIYDRLFSDFNFIEARGKSLRG